MKLLFLYLKPFRKYIFLALALAAINQSFSMMDPILFGKIIDNYATKAASMSQQQFVSGVLWLLLASISVAMVSRIAKAFQDYFTNVVVQKLGASLFTVGLQHSMQLPYAEFEDQRSGETLSILTKVRADCEKLINVGINVLFTSLIGLVFVIIWSLRVDGMIVLIFFTGSLVLAWLTNVLSKRIKSIQKNIVKQTTQLAGTTTESLRNIELVKSLGLTNQEISRLNGNTYKILNLELTKVKRIRSLSFVQGTFVNMLRQCIMFTLLFLIFRGKLQPGEMITLQFFSFFIFGPLQEMGNIILAYREAQASLQNFHTLMSKPAEYQPASPTTIDHIQELSFHNISFQHKTAEQKALDGISFTVRQGETIAFVGPSGSGKSTLVKLLVGLYTPQTGTIQYNGVAANQVNFTELRNKIGFVTQDTQLFAGTIKENLLFVQPTATEADMLAALEKASCTSILQRSEAGMDTVIGEGGLKLSGGEKQRLSIARSLLRKPQLLLFDEATSALDSLTEEAISKTIQQISTDRQQITVLIAHRLSTIMHADKIFVLEKGSIVETGSHETLLTEKGLYYAMWRQQIGERK
ncbi:MAG: ABC transporter ATP-binding protein [Bacteroidetes bacterium]|nr:MAG: ABC transporter ATP-binding protein [Bacteroidota bacterium]TAF97392.1 MAG: ABC transporter ATP-binding protein [Bacteroidota bacterium]